MEDSELVAEALGEHVFEYFIRNKRARVGRLQGAGHARGSSTATWDRCDGDPEPLLVFPDPPPPLLAQTLDLARLPVEGGRERVDRDAGASRPTAGPARSCAPTTTPRARSASAARCASATARSSRCCCSSSGAQLGELELREDLFDDFCLAPFHPKELEARLRHLFWRTGRGARPEIVEYGDLVLNLETYQAALDGAPARPHLHGVRAAEVLRHAPGQGVHPRAAAVAGVGLRVLRRRAHGRRPRAAAAGQARRGAREPDPDRALGRLPLRVSPRWTPGGADEPLRPRRQDASGAASARGRRRRRAASPSARSRSRRRASPRWGTTSSMTTAMTMPPATTTRA